MKKIITTFAIIKLILFISSTSLACSPAPGDSWFVENLVINSQNSPSMFAVKHNKLVPTTASASKCLLLNDKILTQWSFEDGASHNCNSSQINKDDRPHNVSIPKNVDCKIRIFCEPKVHRIKFQLKYEKSNSASDMSQKYHRIELLDRASVPKEIDIGVLSAKSKTGHDFHTLTNNTDKTLCTMNNTKHGTEDRVRIPYLIDLYHNKSPETVDAPPTAPLDFSFDVKCYTQQFVINASLTYSLKKNYIPDLRKKGAEACGRLRRR